MDAAVSGTTVNLSWTKTDSLFTDEYIYICQDGQTYEKVRTSLGILSVPSLASGNHNFSIVDSTKSRTLSVIKTVTISDTTNENDRSYPFTLSAENLSANAVKLSWSPTQTESYSQTSAYIYVDEVFNSNVSVSSYSTTISDLTAGIHTFVLKNGNGSTATEISNSVSTTVTNTSTKLTISGVYDSENKTVTLTLTNNTSNAITAYIWKNGNYVNYVYSSTVRASSTTTFQPISANEGDTIVIKNQYNASGEEISNTIVVKNTFSLEAEKSETSVTLTWEKNSGYDGTLIYIFVDDNFNTTALAANGTKTITLPESGDHTITIKNGSDASATTISNIVTVVGKKLTITQSSYSSGKITLSAKNLSASAINAIIYKNGAMFDAMRIAGSSATATFSATVGDSIILKDESGNEISNTFTIPKLFLEQVSYSSGEVSLKVTFNSSSLENGYIYKNGENTGIYFTLWKMGMEIIGSQHSETISASVGDTILIRRDKNTAVLNQLPEAISNTITVTN